LESILPFLVNNEDYKSINYNGLIPYLIEAIKDLNNKINILESKINKLDKK